jgi:anti-sigma B factor antagonist
MSRERRSNDIPQARAILSCPQSDTTLCTVTGKIDANTTPILRDSLDDAVRDENRHLVIDLSAVTFLDSTGLHALFAARHQHDIRGGGKLVAVFDTDSPTIPPLYVVGLEMAFELHDSLAEALRTCAGAPRGTRRQPAGDDGRCSSGACGGRDRS